MIRDAQNNLLFESIVHYNAYHAGLRGVEISEYVELSRYDVSWLDKPEEFRKWCKSNPCYEGLPKEAAAYILAKRQS